MRRQLIRFLKKKFSKKIVSELEKRLNFYKKNNLNFEKVLDIGAHNGEWKELFQKIFPEIRLVLVFRFSLSPGILGSLVSKQLCGQQ